MRSVARRADVSRPSLLLRWPDRDSLILETLERIVEWPRPDPSAGLRDELEAIVARVVELMDPPGSRHSVALGGRRPTTPQTVRGFSGQGHGRGVVAADVVAAACRRQRRTARGRRHRLGGRRVDRCRVHAHRPRPRQRLTEHRRPASDRHLDAEDARIRTGGIP